MSNLNWDAPELRDLLDRRLQVVEDRIDILEKINALETEHYEVLNRLKLRQVDLLRQDYEIEREATRRLAANQSS